MMKTKRAPYNLRELTLDNCHISTEAFDRFLTSRGKAPDRLNKLALWRMKFLDPAYMKSIIKWIENNKMLTHFELSWSRIARTDFDKLVEAVCLNRTLQELNLSFNCPELEKEQDYSESLKSFIKYNKNLMHLNLAGCGITLPMFETITEGVRSSMTIVSLNFSANPFLDNDLMFELPKEKQIFKVRDESLFVEPANILKSTNSAEVAMLSKEARLRQLLMKEDEYTSPNDIFLRRDFYLERKLGHRKDLPGHNHWMASRSDGHKKAHSYYTGKHVYSYVFYSKSIAEHQLRSDE